MGSLVTYGGSTTLEATVVQRQIEELTVVVAGKAENSRVDFLHGELQRLGEVVGPLCRGVVPPLGVPLAQQPQPAAPGRPKGASSSARATTYKHRPLSARSGR